MPMEQEELTLLKFNQSIWTNVIEAVIIAMIVLIPTIFYPRVIDIFDPIKTLTFSLLVIVALMFWGFNVLKKEEFKIISNPLNIPILSFIIICVLSLIWSNSPFISLKELPLFLAGPLLYFIIVNNIYDERKIYRIIGAVIIVGTLFGIYGILQYNGIDFLFWIGNYGRGKVFGLFGNAGYFSEYLILPLPIAVSLFLVTKNKIIKLLLLFGILAMGSAVVLTFTRTPYLALGISFIVMGFFFFVSKGKNFFKENKKIFIILLIIIILITVLFTISTSLSKKDTIISKIKERASIAQIVNEFSAGRRTAIWRYASLMIKDHPWLGSGIGTFKYNTLRYQAKFFDQGDNRALYPYGVADKTHNEYLQLGAELGIIGLIIFIWVIFTYFNYGLKILKREKERYRQGVIIGLMGSVIVFLVDSIFWFPLHHSFTNFLFWLCLGLLVVMGLKEDEAVYKSKPNKKIISTKNDIYQFKPLLFICIILLAAVLSTFMSRPFIARIYWYDGFKEIKKENWNEAIKKYEEALSWDPYLGEVYYDIGKILQNKELYGVAGEYLEKAEKYIDHPDLPLDLAIIYLKSGMLDEAAIKLKQAISYQPDEKSMLPLYAELGNTYLQLKRYKPAEIVLKDALKIDSNFINAHYGLAGAYLNQNKIEEALVELQKVVELAPGSQEAKNAQNIMQQITQGKLQAPPTEPDKP
ncbi:MAG: O-antigen ligase family protein [Atribacterota bacterium]|nr:O-antigen ligase family protein [Atribacterota bacterium]